MPDRPIYEDGTYLEHNPTWHVEHSPWKAGEVAKLLDRNGVRPRTVCEVGCGAGEVLLSLAERLGPEVAYVGYEISPQAFALCSGKARDGVRFVHADLLADPDARFDVVLAIDVFEHVDDYLGFLRRLRAHGERFVFHIPLDLSVQTVLRARPLAEVRRSVGHLHYFTKETALATLRDAGFEVLDHAYTKGSLELDDLSWRAKLLKLPRKVAFAAHPDLTVRVLGGFSLMVLAR
jgi:SAM-dependent methyltransferase